MSHKTNRHLSAGFLMLAVASVVIVILCAFNILAMIGRFVVHSEEPLASDAVVVLYTGTEYYPRLLQAATLYRQNLAAKVVINGDRKTETLRRLESAGFQPCCAWYENYVRILNLYGVPETDIITIGAEEVYDTITEAAAVGPRLIQRGVKTVMVTTSKFHTRRAGHIWKQMFDGRLSIRTIAADADPFDPSNWWRDGRQIRWVLAEYGAWLFYTWKRISADHTVARST